MYIFKRIYTQIFIHVIMNCQGHNNIRNGIVWVQTRHSICTCTCMLFNFEHTKNSKRSKKSATTKINSNQLKIPKPSKSFEFISERTAVGTNQQRLVEMECTASKRAQNHRWTLSSCRQCEQLVRKYPVMTSRSRMCSSSDHLRALAIFCHLSANAASRAPFAWSATPLSFTR